MHGGWDYAAAIGAQIWSTQLQHSDILLVSAMVSQPQLLDVRVRRYREAATVFPHYTNDKRGKAAEVGFRWPRYASLV